MLTQTPQARRIAPLEVEYVGDDDEDGRPNDSAPLG